MSDLFTLTDDQYRKLINLHHACAYYLKHMLHAQLRSSNNQLTPDLLERIPYRDAPDALALNFVIGYEICLANNTIDQIVSKYEEQLDEVIKTWLANEGKIW